MHGHRSGRRGASLVWLVVALSLLATACGGPTTPSPSTASTAPSAVASPSPTAAPSATPAPPTPSPTPAADVAKLASAILTAPSFTGEAQITGALAQGPVKAEITGSMAFAPGASSFAMSMLVGTTRITTESRSVGGSTYTRNGSGPWFAQAPGASGGADFMPMLATLEDRGTTTVNGASLHRLVATTPMTPADIGLGSMSGTDGTASVEILATDDGKPAVMVMQADWTTTLADGSTTPGSIHLELAFSCTGCTVAIAEPDEVFGTFTSKKLGYSLALPHDWDAQLAAKASEADWFYSPDDRVVGGFRFATSLTLNQYAKEFIAYAKAGGDGAYKKFVLVSSTAATAAGRPARLVAYHATLQGRRQYVITIFVKIGGKMTEIDLLADPGHEAEDNALMEIVRTTLTIP